MPTKRVVVLGAGYGGIYAAKTLHKKLRREDVEITLIDQNNYHTLLTELHEVAGNRIESSGVQISVRHVLQYTKVKFIQDKILRADLQEKKLFSADHEYPFDYLVLALGSEPAYYGIPGMKEHSFTLWSVEDAERIHRHIIDMFEKASREKNAEKRREMLTFIVGGGGFTGIEMVGELMEWTRRLSRKYKIDPNEVSLKVVEALPTILPILNEKLVSKCVRFLEKNGVELLTNSPICEVTPSSITLKSGQVIATKTLIWTGGIQAKEFVKNLGLTLGKRNRIVVNEHLQTKEYPYVYAIGDAMEFMENGQPLPALVETAMQSGQCAAANIAADILQQEKKQMKSNLHGVMVSIGSVFAVADLKGMPLMSGILATFMKHMVNMHYLFEIGGLELVWGYLMEQFGHRERVYNWFMESVIGHLKPRTFTFWLVPARIYLGIMWLASGLMKIKNGWLDWEKLGPADATSSASVMSLVSDHTPGWYAWIVERFIYPNSMLFQKMVVFTEIGLGILFICGAFTFIAALVAIVMNINFMLTTGLPINAETGIPDMWFFFVSIAMLAGAGRSFGVDYYLMPFLQRQLRYFQKNKAFNLLKGWSL